MSETGITVRAVHTAGVAVAATHDPAIIDHCATVVTIGAGHAVSG